MSKKKFYAIKRGKKGTKNVILESWDECSKLVLGFDSEYKGFKTREEAEEYLGISIKSSDSIDNEIQEEISIDNIEDIEKESEKVTIKKKLAKIKDSDINWFKDKVNNSLNDIQNIISSVGLDMKIENGEIISNDTSELIHLIQDDYLKSNLSGDDYVTDKKTKIKKC